MYSAKKIIYFIVYLIVLTISLGVFVVFKPFTYIDNDKSRVVCNKNNASFEIGPNYIYTFGNKLDQFNDEKARKLCEYSIIRDYGNTYKTPAEINYSFIPSYVKNSSWGDALLVSFAGFLIGSFIIETLNLFLNKKHVINITYIVVSFLPALIFFFFFLKNIAVKINCKRQIAQKVVNFRNSAFKSGVIPIPEEDKHINLIIKPLYEKCLRSN